jgi:phage terminase large subunit-like protein
MPWQQHVADVSLELDPDTGELWYEEVVITVPRQSGKTTLLIALMVWRCVMFARRLGVPQTVTYLAQARQSARKKLEREFIPLLRKATGLREVPHSRARPVKDTEFKPSMNNGSEHVLFGTQSYLQIEAVGESSSHGDVLDMPVIDEAFVHGDDLVEQAVDAATVTRRSPQTCVISTAGNGKSRFLWRKVLAGRGACERGEHGRTAYFEWSVPDGERWDDPTVWPRYLPALGHTITLARLLARLEKALRNPDEVDEDGYEPGVAGFRRGYLNQWVETPDLTGAEFVSEIPGEVWMAPNLVDSSSEIVGATVVGVGVAKDGLSASVVVAGRRADGLPHVETLERASGVWWIERYVRAAVEDHGALFVAWDNGGPARTIAPDLIRAAGGKDRARPLNGREWSGACEAFKVAVSEGRVRHLGDVLLLDAVTGASRRVTGDGWVWDMSAARSDVTPLTAATAALRALEMLAPPVPAHSLASVGSLADWLDDD